MRLTRKAILSFKNAAGLIIGLAVIGTIATVVTSASIFVASSEAESGSRTSNAQLVTNSGASGGQSVKFGASSCSKPTPRTASAYEQVLRGDINGKWYHGDAGQSVLLSNGKNLWVYGDTLIAAAGQARSSLLINNSAIMTDGGCAVAITGPTVNGKETTWITPTALTDTPNVTDYYWPNTPFMDGSTLRLFLSHMYSDSSGFHPIGIDLASFDLSSGKPVLQSIVKTPASSAGTATPLWGGLVLSSGGYNYIFGSINKNETYILGHYQYLARVATGKATSQADWQYWNGSTWVANQSSAQAIIPGIAGIGVGASGYIKPNGEVVIVAKKYDNLGTDLFAWKAPQITGPYTEKSPALLAPIPPANFTAKDTTYAGLAHPQAVMASGKLLISFSRNSDDLAFFGDGRYGNYFAEVAQP